MNTDDEREAELKRREEELRQRELALRLKELEADLYQPPLYETVKHEEPESKFKRSLKKLVKVAKFLGVVVAVVVTIKIAVWLSTVVVIGAVAWVAYKIFLEEKRPNR